ncbi:hypothetical protein CHU92_04660 [Flavobacterium cyanobacteriorum]|uniref:DUF72 domain-containing protein n=2 Tax=Flavobacterium cyanobacteriorum TaxID=2022802 RepID=A0A255ZG38_9FLAO|nr:hypothetical protein CHU92_04660 [Flavobacterium cyanobacteriorum]
MMQGKIHIGTSGWSYKHWRGNFYPAEVKVKDHFTHFKKFFNTVELNNPFYHLPPRQTFEKWYNSTPDDFVFAVKANRYITHLKKLRNADESLAYFLQNAEGLQQKLGVILFQLPPGWQLDLERFRDFLQLLPARHRYTFEFRNATWYTGEVFSLLKQHNCAFCIYELAGHISPLEVTADFIYIRLHGPGGKYQGSYSEEALQWWAASCKSWSASGKDVYIYFDNDQEGYAAFNALRLMELVAPAIKNPQ